MATPKNLKQFRHQKSIVQSRMKKLKGAAETVASDIAKITCVIKKKVGDQGKLFGAVTTQDITDRLRQGGVQVDRRKVQLANPIKSLGDFKAHIRLHPEVTAEINISVVKDESKEEVDSAKESPTKQDEPNQDQPTEES